MIPTDPVELARIAYQAYGSSTDHLNVRGELMPTWDDLGGRIQDAWTAAASAVANACREVP